jgi:hypothetical protein
MAVLIDTSFLVALSFPKDCHHDEARQALRTLKDVRVIAEPVVSEFFRIMYVRESYQKAVAGFLLTRNPVFQVVHPIEPDLERMHDIMVQYADAELDYTDVAIMAVAERLNIEQIYTFDRRDFSIFRPNHCEYLNLLP